MIHTFRISAQEDWHWFDVKLFESRSAYDAYLEEIGAPPLENPDEEITGGIVRGRVYDEPIDTGTLGEILFCADMFVIDIIQHELLHAAMLYERNVYGNRELSFAAPHREERLCRTQQNLLVAMQEAMSEAGLHDFGPPEEVEV